MALVLNDRVLETCTSPGTGSVTLLGAATGYKTFSVGVGNTNTCYYAISDQSGANWEVGVGTYSSAGNTLARTTVLSSSNSGSLTNFSTGTQNVYVTYPSEKAVYLDATGQLNLTNASNYNLYASGAGANYFGGKVGFGVLPYSDTQLTISSSSQTGTVNQAVVLATGIPSTATSVYYGILSYPSTVASAFTLASLRHFQAAQNTIGASSVVTNQYGFVAENSLIGATNNYGFYGNIASGAGRYNFYANGTAANVFAGTTSLGGAVGSESLRVTPVASAVNYVNIVGSTTGLGAGISSAGSDTNIALAYSSKGSSAHQFFTNNYGQLQFVVAHTASAVNYLQVTGAATGGSPTLSIQGSDTNVGLNITSKGTGSIGYFGQSHTFYGSGAPQLQVATTASAVNYLQLTGAVTGGAPVVSTQGSDANIPIIISPKGTGGVGIGGTPAAGESVRVGKNITGAITTYGIVNQATVQSDVTTAAIINDTYISTQAAAFTLGSLAHYQAEQGTIGAASAITNQYGFRAQSSLIGATNNYGFYGTIAAGTGRYNFYATGTAANYMAGTLAVNGAVATPAGGSTTAFLQMGSTAGFGIYFGSGAPTITAPQGSIYIRSDGSSTSTRMYVNTTGSTTWTNLVTAA